MNDILWSEKYRPSVLDDLVASPNIKQRLSTIIENRTANNYIIIGSHGHGKTCVVNILGQMLFEQPDKSILKLDAYDYRGNKTIHETINSYCRVRCLEGFKFIVFDDIDNIDDKMQTQLIPLIDKYNKKVKFIFISNTSENIIESIQSRCLLMRINRPEMVDIIDRLKHILDCESIGYDDESIERIYSLSDGDIRQAINILQLIGIKYGAVNIDNINSLYDIPQREMVENIYRSMMEHDVDRSLELTMELINSGYSNTDIVNSMFYYLRTIGFVPDDVRMKLMNEFARTAYVLSTEVDSKLQLFSCIVSCCAV